VPKGVSVLNYAFDVTPHKLISHIITEKGILERPFVQSIAQIKAE
jgi:methylthioribose-1-phosphate isomerase